MQKDIKLDTTNQKRLLHPHNLAPVDISLSSTSSEEERKFNSHSINSDLLLEDTELGQRNIEEEGEVEEEEEIRINKNAQQQKKGDDINSHDMTRYSGLPPGHPSESYASKATRIAIIVSSYWVVSISMVFLNKYLLSSPELRLDAPLFITWFQCVVAVACCWLLGEARKYHSAFEMFPPFQVSLDISIKCLPLSAVFVGMIAFNNLCLREMGVSFYNVGRSLTTIFNVLLSYLMLGQKTSMQALFWCAILVFGFILGVDQEGELGDLSAQGVIFGILASLFVALNAIYVKKILPLVEDNSWRLTLYNNLNAVVLFVPLMLMSGEHITLSSFERLDSSYFWFMMILGGIFGVLIGVVMMLQIKYTSPLTHNISGTAKACVQTVLAVFVNDEHKNGLWWLSNVLVMGASAGYTHVRSLEMQRKDKDNKENNTSNNNNMNNNDNININMSSNKDVDDLLKSNKDIIRSRDGDMEEEEETRLVVDIDRMDGKGGDK
jgi:GDP-fucose transporter C1